MTDHDAAPESAPANDAADHGPRLPVPRRRYQRPAGPRGDAASHLPAPLRADRGGAAGPGNESSDDTLKRLLVVLRRGWKTVAGAAAVGGIVGLVFCAATARRYTASVTVLIGQPSERVGKDASETGPVSDNQLVERRGTLSSRILGLDVADSVLSAPGVRERLADVLGSETAATAAPVGTYTHSPAALESYLKIVRVVPVPQTSLTNISVTTGDPVLSRDLADAHARAFIAASEKSQREGLVGQIALLQSQAEEVKGKLAGVERGIAEYAERTGNSPFLKDEAVLARELSELLTARTSVSRERLRASATLDSVGATGPVRSTALDDESVSRLRTSLEEAEAAYADLRRKFTDDYPPVTQLGARISSLKRSVSAGREQARRALVAREKALASEEAELDRRILRVKEVSNKTFRGLTEYGKLSEEYEGLKNLRQAVLARLSEAQVRVTAVDPGVQIVEEAAVPHRPSFPKPVPTVLFTTVLGTLFGAALTLVRAALDKTVREGSTSIDRVGIPRLGAVPELDDVPAPVPDLSRTSFSLRQAGSPGRGDAADGPPDGGSDGRRWTPGGAGPVLTLIRTTVEGRALKTFQLLRNGIYFAARRRDPLVVLVTAPEESCGSTTVVSNLALPFAQSGKPTLLVDTHAERPELSRRFALDGQAGFFDALVAPECAIDFVYPTNRENLSVMPCGTHAARASGMMDDGALAVLFARLRETFEVVLVDGASLLSPADTILLSAHSDLVALVLRHGRSTVPRVTECLELLEGAGAPAVGYVLNATPRPAPGGKRRAGLYRRPGRDAGPARTAA